MNRDKVKAAAWHREYYLKNRERLLAKQVKYRQDNFEDCAARDRQYVLDHPEQVREYKSKYRRNNPHVFAASGAKYRASKMGQTPDDANKMWIDMIYEYRPEGYEVDHIIPLSKGGLHHEDNLQYLTKSENCRKGNRI